MLSLSIVIPCTSKIFGGVTFLLFTAWLTAQQVKQTVVAVKKAMAYFIRFLVVKQESSSVIFMLL